MTNRRKWDLTYPVKPLLYKMVQSNCINHIRHKNVKKKYADFKIHRNELFDENFEEYEALIEKLIKTIDNFPEQNRFIFKRCFLDGIKNFRNTLISHYIANDFVLFCERDYNRFTELINCFEGDTLNSDIKEKIFAKYEKTKSQILTGKAPDFELKDINNQKIKLSSFRGKYVLLDFWASWCAPCRKKNKHLKKYYKEFKSKGMAFVSVSLDNDKSKWVKAVKEDNLPWTQLADLRGFKGSKIKEQYKVQQVPTVFLIDPEGNIVKQNPSFEDIKNVLNIK